MKPSMRARIARAGGRRAIVATLRAYDFLVALGGAAVLVAWQWSDAQCASVATLLPVALFATSFITLNAWRPEFGYGSDADLAGVAMSTAIAGAATGFALLRYGDCAPAIHTAWLLLAALVVVPRAAAAVVRRRYPGAKAGGSKVTVHPPAMARTSRTAWIICLSAPVDEPRVRRQADALEAAGWNVVAFGYPGRATKPNHWTLVEIPRGDSVPAGALSRLFAPMSRRIALLGARYSARLADARYWAEPAHRHLLDRIAETAHEYALDCHLICHHDFFTAPIAAKLAADRNVPFTSDVHEYARGQFMDRWAFRAFTSHYVHRLQQLYYPRAELLSVVCQGIADLLAREYRLKRPPLIVRNVSFYEPMPLRPVGERIRVLYHGLLYHARGLEQSIDSVPLWRPEFELVIRGLGPADYVEGLRLRARSLGVEGRVRFEPPVPVTELVTLANECDIGLFASSDYSPQKYFTAPNKLFEYVMAGLALCVSDLPEMRRVVVEYDLGRMFDAVDARSMADAINGFTRETINVCKRRSLAAARVLCWENERRALADAYNAICSAKEVHAI